MSFDEATAEVYDKHTLEDENAVAFLAEIARGGPALELAIGTGRIALPLARRGIRVDGIDISPAMVAKLRAKQGGDQLKVTIGDFSLVPVEGAYRLIYLVANTLFNLLTQDEQVRCFQNVVPHLCDEGVFVIEAFTPINLMDLRDDQYVKAEAVEMGEVRLDVVRHDSVHQLLYESHLTFTAGGVRLEPIVTRYAWPSEMDLMARIAGLSLRERWTGWNREPVRANSRSLVSVYGRPAAGVTSI